MCAPGISGQRKPMIVDRDLQSTEPRESGKKTNREAWQWRAPTRRRKQDKEARR
jgi:hypothetical protein